MNSLSYATHHELLENIVLNGAGKLGLSDTLRLRRGHVHCDHRQHGAVHGHGNGYLRAGQVERPRSAPKALIVHLGRLRESTGSHDRHAHASVPLRVRVYLVQWDAIKELLHVQDGVNGDARHSHITRDTRIV